MFLIVIEASKILINPEIQITMFSPLIFYTVAEVATTILSVVVIYRNYRRIFKVEESN